MSAPAIRGRHIEEKISVSDERLPSAWPIRTTLTLSVSARFERLRECFTLFGRQLLANLEERDQPILIEGRPDAADLVGLSENRLLVGRHRRQQLSHLHVRTPQRSPQIPEDAMRCVEPGVDILAHFRRKLDGFERSAEARSTSSAREAVNQSETRLCME